MIILGVVLSSLSVSVVSSSTHFAQPESSSSIEISSLILEDIHGGWGLTIHLRNNASVTLTDLTFHLSSAGGLFVRLPQDHYTLPDLSPGEDYTAHIAVFGVGLGFLLDYPHLFIDVSGPTIDAFRLTVVTRLIGPFVVKIGEYLDIDESCPGYTIFSPMLSLSTYCINTKGEVVHTWESNLRPRLSVYLLEDGSILRPGDIVPNPVFAQGGGNGGNVQIIDWNSTITWDFEYSTNQYCLHHDVEMLPNGNILMIAWEYKTAYEAINAGRDPSTLIMGELWADHIIEVEPTGPTTGTIVWEWHVWDHLIQDYDPGKDNFGPVAEHPELIDLNYVGNFGADWNHINSVDYHEDLDQILLSVRHFNEIWVIDHSTTSEEAAGHTGGRYGKGGDLLYRWGNPQTYRAGTQEDQQFYYQHDGRWIDPGLPGAGNILVFNNGPPRHYSTVEELNPPIDEEGNYSYVPGEAYGPLAPYWTYMSENPYDFFALNLGSAHRLPNGNTLICNGPYGILFEVTPDHQIIWEYLNTHPNVIDNNVFSALKYPVEYPGFDQLED